MNSAEVLNLAKLARIEISNSEAEILSGQFDSILGYVGEVKQVGKADYSKKLDKNSFPVRNVFREEGEPHESGIYTKDLLAQAPERKGDYIKVKKIL